MLRAPFLPRPISLMKRAAAKGVVADRSFMRKGYYELDIPATRPFDSSRGFG
jgi:hypothetical protein